jgi:hypothetical protein
VAVIAKRLELEDEFVDYVPYPVVREFQVYWLARVEDKVEEVAVVIVRGETVLGGGGQARVDVAVVQFSVKDKKLRVVVYDRGDCFCVGPRSLLKELFSQTVELVLVTALHFINVVLQIRMIEMGQVTAHSIRHSNLLNVSPVEVCATVCCCC